MKFLLSIDRFERDEDQQVTVLLFDDGRQLEWPGLDMLPKGVKAGDVLSFDIARDLVATKKLKAATRKLQDELKKRDPGGDIKL